MDTSSSTVDRIRTPRKAAEGYRLRILAIEDESAEVVWRIFAEYLDYHQVRRRHEPDAPGQPVASADVFDPAS